MGLDTSASIWQGKLVRLRSHEPDDWENYWIWDQDSESERKDGPLSFPRSQEWMKHWTREDAVRKQEGNNWRFLLENNEGKVVGRIGPHDCDPRAGHFQYGIAISKEYRRKGVHGSRNSLSKFAQLPRSGKADGPGRVCCETLLVAIRISPFSCLVIFLPFERKRGSCDAFCLLPWGVAVIDRSCPQVANQGKDDAPGNSEDRAVTHQGPQQQSLQGVDDRREGLVLGEPAYPNRHRVRADGGTLPRVLSSVVVRVRTVCVN